MAFLLRKRDFLILLLAVFAYYYIVEDEGHTLASSMNSTAKHMFDLLPYDIKDTLREWKVLATSVWYYYLNNDERSNLPTSESKIRDTSSLITTTTTSSSTTPADEMDFHKKYSNNIHFSLWWMGPAFSGGGYSSEMISFSKSLSPYLSLSITQHGDSISNKFVDGLPPQTKALLQRLSYNSVDPRGAVVICHSEPGAWNPPLYQTSRCPPTELENVQRNERVVGPKINYPNSKAKRKALSKITPLYKIGRTMFEADGIVPEWVSRCNAMDEIWVPTEFHIETFAASGVNRNKLVKIPEPVDVDFFNPYIYTPLTLPIGTLAVGKGISSHDSSNNNNNDSNNPEQSTPTFSFLSVFKWEPRKAWDILIKAYLLEFSNSNRDNVALYLLTNPFHSDRNFTEQIKSLIEQTGDLVLGQVDLADLPPIYVIDTHVPEQNLPRLYKAVNCLVIPSRGEGWGRPHVEAMSMGLPIIATNWSGPTEFLNETNGYPLSIDGLVEIESGAYRGLKWAQPSLTHLRQRMRQVYESRYNEAPERGFKARQTMIQNYRPDKVAQIVLERLVKVQSIIDERADNDDSDDSDVNE